MTPPTAPPNWGIVDYDSNLSNSDNESIGSLVSKLQRIQPTSSVVGLTHRTTSPDSSTEYLPVLHTMANLGAISHGAASLLTTIPLLDFWIILLMAAIETECSVFISKHLCLSNKIHMLQTSSANNMTRLDGLCRIAANKEDMKILKGLMAHAQTWSTKRTKYSKVVSHLCCTDILETWNTIVSKNFIVNIELRVPSILSTPPQAQTMLNVSSVLNGQNPVQILTIPKSHIHPMKTWAIGTTNSTATVQVTFSTFSLFTPFYQTRVFTYLDDMAFEFRPGFIGLPNPPFYTHRRLPTFQHFQFRLQTLHTRLMSELFMFFQDLEDSEPQLADSPPPLVQPYSPLLEIWDRLPLEEVLAHFPQTFILDDPVSEDIRARITNR